MATQWVARLLAVTVLCGGPGVSWAGDAGGVSDVDHAASASAQASSAAGRSNAAVEGRRHVAVLWAESGWQLVEAGEYDRAARAFTVAKELAPGEASIFVGLGVSAHRRFRDGLALAALEHALQLDPAIGQAHALLGDVHVRQGALSAAVRHYDAAHRQDPNDVTVQERLLNARRERDVEARFDRLLSPHFVVLYQGEGTRGLAHEVAERLEAVYDEIGRMLGYFPDETVTVRLYPEEQFRAATLTPVWARAFFDGRMHLPSEGVRANAETMERMLKHEYVHAVVYRLSGGHAPAWLNEGLALFGEGGASAEAGDLLAPHTGDLEPLSSLHGSFLGRSQRAASAAYAESDAAVRLLIQRYGLAKVRRLLEELSSTPDMQKAFERVFHERYRDFDRRLVSSQGGPG